MTPRGGFAYVAAGDASPDSSPALTVIEARAMAREALAAAARGEDPMGERTAARQSETVAGLFDLYEIVPGILLSTAAIVATSLADQPPSEEIRAEFDRLRRVRDYLDDETFCMTYGDGVSDIDITAEIEFHQKAGLHATMAAIKPPGRFGAFSLHPEDEKVMSFHEKPQGDGAWINGGFFVLEPKVLDYIDSDSESWEQAPLQYLAEDGQLGAFRHAGFWQPMDTLRDKHVLEDLWSSGKAPWKVWSE